MPLSRFFEGDLNGRKLYLYGRPGTSKTSMLLQTIARLPSIDPTEVLWSTGIDDIVNLSRTATRLGMQRTLKRMRVTAWPSIEFMLGYAEASNAKLLVLDHFGAKERELLESLRLRRIDVDPSPLPMIVVVSERRARRIPHLADAHLEVSSFQRSGDARRLLRVDVPKNRFGSIGTILLSDTKRGVRVAT